MNCPHCNSKRVHSRGKLGSGKNRYSCIDCGRWFNTGLTDKGESYEQGDDFINIICASERMLSKEDVIRKFNIDLSVWEIDRFKVKTSEGYRKDRAVKWRVKEGVVVEGNVNDSGKMLVVPLYHIEVRFIKKKEEVEVRGFVKEIINDAKKFVPKYPKITYTKHKEKYLFEPDMPDIHFGKLSWGEESGDNYDIKIAEQMSLDHLTTLINRASPFTIDKILFPIGNDYFNVNNKDETTVNGTKQQEDVRYQKTFVAGRKLAVKMIDMLSAIAPVQVIIVPGNHDEERTFYLGDSLECWYQNNRNVSIDNSAKKRKYFVYGKNLIGFTHGYHEKLNELPLIMATEEREKWAKCSHFEWQTGDKHHKKEILTTIKEHEQKGVMVRILRSISGNDAWHFDKGYIGQNRFIEAFIRHENNGLVAQITSSK